MKIVPFRAALKRGWRDSDLPPVDDEDENTLNPDQKLAAIAKEHRMWAIDDARSTCHVPTADEIMKMGLFDRKKGEIPGLRTRLKALGLKVSGDAPECRARLAQRLGRARHSWREE